jgi:hypothetical protein
MKEPVDFASIAIMAMLGSSFDRDDDGCDFPGCGEK